VRVRDLPARAGGRRAAVRHRRRDTLGPEYAAAFARHLGAPVSFYDMPFDDYRALGFPGADDMGNMYEHHSILGEEFLRLRSPEVARALNPALQTFDVWLGANASRIPLAEGRIPLAEPAVRKRRRRPVAGEARRRVIGGTVHLRGSARTAAKR